MKSNKAVGVVKMNKSDYIDEVVGTFVDRKNGCCALCGNRCFESSKLRGDVK